MSTGTGDVVHKHYGCGALTRHISARYRYGTYIIDEATNNIGDWESYYAKDDIMLTFRYTCN
jgi:hypothetical protein